MNGPHDLGGKDGFGPVQYDGGSEPVFHADWERAALTMFPASARAGLFQLDQFRYGMEKMEDTEYLGTTYYEHWAHSIAHHAIDKGLFSEEELREREQYYRDHPDAPMPDRRDPELMDFFGAVLVTGASTAVASDKKPAFSVGDTVTVLDGPRTGHTRRAAYIRGKTGVITLAHGTFVYPDGIANGEEETAEHVYNIEFTAAELWGAGVGDPNANNRFDVWEPYIRLASVPATQGA